MNRTIDIDTVLARITGENPSGEDLRYTQVYDDIKEARRADDPFELGDWQRQTKSSDWDKVFTLTRDALQNKSKDLQIAAWLAESLLMSNGFNGLDTGLRVITGLLEAFWDTVFPEVEDEDLEYRIAPLEFLNDRLSNMVRQLPLTEPGATPGYSLLKWRESRDVGLESETRNKYGDVDEQKKRKRDDLLSEGRISAEEFDGAVTKTSQIFFRTLAGDLANCRKAFRALDTVVDEKFGSNAPRLSELRDVIDECERLVSRFCPVGGGTVSDENSLQSDNCSLAAARERIDSAEIKQFANALGSAVSGGGDVTPVDITMMNYTESLPQEEIVWKDALIKTAEGKFREALDYLITISNSQSSERGRNRYRFLVAKLCLKAERPDLALPIVEQLHATIADLQLERWESPLWIAGVLEALYQCLMSGQPSDEKITRGNELFRRICTLDVTKALVYRK